MRGRKNGSVPALIRAPGQNKLYLGSRPPAGPTQGCFTIQQGLTPYQAPPSSEAATGSQNQTNSSKEPV